MKKINVSLIFKITCIVFFAFAIVLGNEIRLGIERYVKNTLETDASATVRNLERFSKSYTEIMNTSVDLSSASFQHIYQDAVSDPYKVKALVDYKGKILDVSREIAVDPEIALIVNHSDESYNWPMYFSLETLEKRKVRTLENHLRSGINKNNTITIEVVLDDKEYLQKFNSFPIKKIQLNDILIYENDIEGNVESVTGSLMSYLSDNIEMYYSTNDRADSTNSLSYSSSEHEDNQIEDFRDTIQGLKGQIRNNFNNFKKSGNVFLRTNYADYYLLKPYEYNGKQYSTVMVRLLDWNKLVELDEETSQKLTEEQMQDRMAVGYLFVTQEYENLSMKSFQQFMLDNSSTYFLAFGLIIVICFMIAYMIVKPIRSIEVTARHIARKEFDYPIDMTRHDEIGELARSIDRMSKELEKTINNLYQEVERVQKLEEIRKEFVSNFTHEIKTPLSIINGFSELVELENDEKKRNEYIDIIQNETGRINELVLAMLDLSKLESQNIVLDLEEIDLLDIVDENLATMGHMFKKKNIQLETFLNSATIIADSFKMEMVINNFIANALRYTKEGHKVIVRLDDYMFSVENEGSKIPEEELEKIWLTFHKVDKSRNEKGTGLGLAICRAILELHHFEYGVKNTETSVFFYFSFKNAKVNK